MIWPFNRALLPSFVAGALVASALAAIPAVAGVDAQDEKRRVFDGTTPVLTVKPVEFRVGRSISAAEEPSSDPCSTGGTWNTYPLRLRWDATDATSGVQSFDVIVNMYASDTNSVTLGPTGATSYALEGWNYHGGCGGGQDALAYYWITVRDHRGNTATSAVMDNRDALVWDEAGVDQETATDALSVTRTGRWRTSSCTCFNHGTTTYSTVAGASLTYGLDVARPGGRTFAVVAPRGPNRGVMRISVDGAAATTVDTYAATAKNRVIVWQKTLGAGHHTIKVSNAGTTGRSRVDVDSLMLGPEWAGEAMRSHPTE